jgi:dolichol-phosphate mannosyltransferase
VVELSIVVPVYGCADCLVHLHQRLKTVLETITPHYEIIFVDDRSLDGSWNVIAELASQDSKVKSYRLSRNFGQHLAITAGFAQSSGQWIITMDCDLQDPPEKIPHLYEIAVREGYDIVFTRRKPEKISSLRRLASWLNFKLVGIFFTKEQDSSLTLLSRKVVDAYLQVQDQDRTHFHFILRWLGFNSAVVEYSRANRYSGLSSYNLRRLFKIAVNNLLQTTVFLKWIVYLGLLVSSSGFFYAIYLVYQYFYRSIYPGWTSLSVLILVIGGFILTSIGVASLYIGKIFEQESKFSQIWTSVPNK